MKAIHDSVPIISRTIKFTFIYSAATDELIVLNREPIHISYVHVNIHSKITLLTSLINKKIHWNLIEEIIPIRDFL
jgi:hypothetical protein